MFIQTEDTPNPSTLKFLPGRMVIDRVVEFKSIEQAQSCPFALQLLQIDGVVAVFLGTDFISVTKTEQAQWFTLKPLILECLVNYFSVHQMVTMGPRRSEDRSTGVEDEITQQIRELIDTRVRPAVAMDGGDITFEKFENGIVYLRLQGACSGCPSSSATLKSGIENMLRYYIPEVQEVRPVDEGIIA